MPRLSLPEYAVLLSKALSCFSFPPVTLDVHTKGERPHEDMRGVEACIGAALRSDHVARVRDGLSDVLFWGYARQGRRDFRVRKLPGEDAIGRRRATAGRIPGVRAIEAGDLHRPAVARAQEVEAAGVRSSVIRDEDPHVSGSGESSRPRPEDRPNREGMRVPAASRIDDPREHPDHDSERCLLRTMGVLVSGHRREGQQSIGVPVPGSESRRCRTGALCAG